MYPNVNEVLGELAVGGLVKILSIELEEPILLQVETVEDGPEGGKTVKGKVADKPAVLYLYPGKHDPMDPFDSVGHIELDQAEPTEEEEKELREFERFARSFDY